MIGFFYQNVSLHQRVWCNNHITLSCGFLYHDNQAIVSATSWQCTLGWLLLNSLQGASPGASGVEDLGSNYVYLSLTIVEKPVQLVQHFCAGINIAPRKHTPGTFVYRFKRTEYLICNTPLVCKGVQCPHQLLHNHIVPIA